MFHPKIFNYLLTNMSSQTCHSKNFIHGRKKKNPASPASCFRSKFMWCHPAYRSFPSLRCSIQYYSQHSPCFQPSCPFGPRTSCSQQRRLTLTRVLPEKPFSSVFRKCMCLHSYNEIKWHLWCNLYASWHEMKIMVWFDQTLIPKNTMTGICPKYRVASDYIVVN